MFPDRSQNSHAFENMIEHLFLGQLLAEMWCAQGKVVEISKADTDAWGYDLVLSSDAVTWHVQMKTSVPVNINMRLFDKQRACVVAAIPTIASEGIELSYRFWEAKSPNGLPTAKRSVYRRGKTSRDERPEHRRVAAGLFDPKMDIHALALRLFPHRSRRRR